MIERLSKAMNSALLKDKLSWNPAASLLQNFMSHAKNNQSSQSKVYKALKPSRFSN